MIVGLDTAGPVIGVGLLTTERCLTRVERVSRGSETRLIPWLMELCEEAAVDLSEIQGIAVAQGPGAFTGLRVGLATAVGLAMSLEVPVLPIMSLHSRAERVFSTLAEPRKPVLSMLDARKGRVYAALYGPDGERLQGPLDVEPRLACGWSADPFVATGEGSVVYRKWVEEAQGALVPGAEDPAVDRLCELGWRRLRQGQGCDPLESKPVYLRAPDAKPPSRSPFGGL